MPKLTYTPQTNDDPESTTTQGVRFEKGKAVEVSDAVYEKLSTNPWFKGSKGKAEAEKLMAGSDDGAVQGDSALNVTYPPGVGSKTAPDYVVVSDGVFAPDSPEATAAGNEVAKRGPGRPKS